MTGRLHAAEQVDRLIGLDCFVPSEKRDRAIDELIQVLMLARDAQSAAIVVNIWLEDHREWPKPADLRTLVFQENARRQQIEDEDKLSGGACKKCDGTGFVIRYFLLTYHGKSVRVKRREYLADVNNEMQAMEFNEKIARLADMPGAERQSVVSAAAPCSCRAVSAEDEQS